MWKQCNSETDRTWLHRWLEEDEEAWDLLDEVDVACWQDERAETMEQEWVVGPIALGTAGGLLYLIERCLKLIELILNLSGLAMDVISTNFAATRNSRWWPKTRKKGGNCGAEPVTPSLPSSARTEKGW